MRYFSSWASAPVSRSRRACLQANHQRKLKNVCMCEIASLVITVFPSVCTSLLHINIYSIYTPAVLRAVAVTNTSRVAEPNRNSDVDELQNIDVRWRSARTYPTDSQKETDNSLSEKWSGCLLFFRSSVLFVVKNSCKFKFCLPCYVYRARSG